MKIVGLDPGKTIGFCLFNSDTLEFHLDEAHMMTPRIGEGSTVLKEMINYYDPEMKFDAVIVENIVPGCGNFKSHDARLWQLSSFFTIDHFFSGHNIILVSPRSLKLDFTGSGGAKKEKMKEVFLKIMGSKIKNHKEVSSHQVDAFALVYNYLVKSSLADWLTSSKFS